MRDCWAAAPHAGCLATRWTPKSGPLERRGLQQPSCTASTVLLCSPAALLPRVAGLQVAPPPRHFASHTALPPQSWMFKRLFGGDGGGGASSSKPLPSNVSQKAQGSTIDAIQKLGETEELLTKRQALLERKIEQELERAKVFLRQNNKRAATMALKKKKLYQNQLEAVENNMLRVSEQQMGLENLRTTVEAVDALRTGAHASKATMQEMKIDDVDRVLDEINDQADQMRQIQDAMGQPIGMAADYDEDDLLGELEELEASTLDETMLGETAAVPGHRIPAEQQQQQLPSMPNAPTTKVQPAAPAKTAEELELEALQAEMAS